MVVWAYVYEKEIKIYDAIKNFYDVKVSKIILFLFSYIFTIKK